MNRKVSCFAPGARAVPASSSSAVTHELGYSEPLLILTANDFRHNASGQTVCLSVQPVMDLAQHPARFLPIRS